jgi:hypothetical protein
MIKPQERMSHEGTRTTHEESASQLGILVWFRKHRIRITRKRVRRIRRLWNVLGVAKHPAKRAGQDAWMVLFIFTRTFVSARRAASKAHMRAFFVAD